MYKCTPSGNNNHIYDYIAYVMLFSRVHHNEANNYYLQFKRKNLTMLAVVLYRQVTSQHRTWFTKRTQINHSLASLQSMAMG